MIPFPKDVRLAQEGDEKRVFDLACLAHGENGWGKVDHATVQGMIRKATRREGCVIAIVDGPEGIEAMLGMQPAKPWYCSDDEANWYWSDLFFYVHPLHRRSHHAHKLLQFAQWWAEAMRHPVVLALLPREALNEKDRLFSRHGKRVGSLFLFGEAPAFDVIQSALESERVISKSPEAIIAVIAKEATG